MPLINHAYYPSKMDLNTRIKIDLGELLYSGQITNALAVEKEFGVASRAIPGYFAGDRNAKTVIVMLNPGIDANTAIYDSIPKLAIYRYLGLNAFVNNLLDGSINGGYNIGSRLDYFDLKTAAFLSAWPNSGILFPKEFFITPKIYDAITDDKNIRIEANRNCLLQKLQLELLPYPSSGFGSVNDSNIKLLVPFVKTLFDEIFRVKRDYIIFAGNVFNTIFTLDPFNHFVTVACSCSTKLKRIDKNNNVVDTKTEFRCTPITINNGKQRPEKAIIANTFPIQSLSKALGLMHQYGKFCYNTFMNYQQQNP